MCLQDDPFGVDKLAQPGAKTILVLGEIAQIWAQNCTNIGAKLHKYGCKIALI